MSMVSCMSEYRRKKRLWNQRKLRRRFRQQRTGRFVTRRAGGGSSRKGPRVFSRHNFRYAPEPKDKVPKPKLEKYGKPEPWTEPELKKPKIEKVIHEIDTDRLTKDIERYLEGKLERIDKNENEILNELDKLYSEQVEQQEEDTEALLKELEKNPSNELVEKAMESMERDYEKLESELIGKNHEKNSDRPLEDIEADGLDSELDSDELMSDSVERIEPEPVSNELDATEPLESELLVELGPRKAIEAEAELEEEEETS